MHRVTLAARDRRQLAHNWLPLLHAFGAVAYRLPDHAAERARGGIDVADDTMRQHVVSIGDMAGHYVCSRCRQPDQI